MTKSQIKLGLYAAATLVMAIEVFRQLFGYEHRDPIFLTIITVCLAVSLFGFWNGTQSRQ